MTYIKNGKEKIVRCECAGHLLSVERWNCDEISLTVWYERTDKTTLWDRIRLAFNILRGRAAHLHDVILSENNCRELGEFCIELADNPCIPRDELPTTEEVIKANIKLERVPL